MASDDFKLTLLAAFQAEAAELLDLIAASLKQSWSDDVAQALFRHFHNLKGTAQLLELENFSYAAQIAELLARSGNDYVQPELSAIHDYLSQCMEHINTHQAELDVYQSKTAEKLLERIASHEETQKKEKQALYQLFSKHLNNLTSSDQKKSNGHLNTLIRATDLMELNDLSVELNNLAAAHTQINDKNLKQQILEKLITHKNFGDEFMNFYQKANS